MTDTKSDSTGFTDVFERIFLLGVGVFSLTKEKIESTVEDLVERGKLSQEEGRDLIADLGDRGMKEKDAFAAFVSEQTRKAIDMANLASKDDVDRLKGEVAQLKKDLAAAKKAHKPKADA